MISLFKELIADFHHTWVGPELVHRKLQVPVVSGKVISVIGPRRSGKTSVLLDLIKTLRVSVGIENIVYINFEDERLTMDASGFQALLDAYQQLYPDAGLSNVYWFFDEIQEITGWEKFIRRMQDTVSPHIFITGSSAKLLGREIATSLRGRTLAYSLYPLSFAEFLDFREEMPVGSEIHSSKTRNRLVAAFDQFMIQGGYPETVSVSPDLRLRIHQSYLNIMIYRDVIERYAIKNTLVAKDLLKRLVRNSSQIFSVNKYYNELKSRNISVSKDLLYHLVDHLAEAFIIGELPKWDPSLIKQQKALKKIYAVDNGLVSATLFLGTGDYGYLLESLVFQELIKKDYQVHYFQNGGECDFVATKDSKLDLIQVCYEMNEGNRHREVKGLVSACRRFGHPTGTILTHHQEDTFEVNGFTLTLVPVWKWALEGKGEGSMSNVQCPILKGKGARGKGKAQCRILEAPNNGGDSPIPQCPILKGKGRGSACGAQGARGEA
jgi:predicted AAA+ superfamily ATPase